MRQVRLPVAVLLLVVTMLLGGVATAHAGPLPGSAVFETVTVSTDDGGTVRSAMRLLTSPNGSRIESLRVQVRCPNGAVYGDGWFRSSFPRLMRYEEARSRWEFEAFESSVGFRLTGRWSEPYKQLHVVLAFDGPDSRLPCIDYEDGTAPLQGDVFNNMRAGRSGEDIFGDGDGGPTPPPAAGTDIASTCGTTKTAWHLPVTHERFVGRRRKACVFLVSNAVAKDVEELGGARSVARVFARLLRDAVADRLEEGVKSRLVGTAFPSWRTAASAAASRFNPLTLIGNTIGLAAVPLVAAYVETQIQRKGACLAFFTTASRRRLKVEWQLVPSGRSPRLFQKDARSLARDRFKSRRPHLRCGSGGVDTEGAGSAGQLFSSHETTLG